MINQISSTCCKIIHSKAVTICNMNQAKKSAVQNFSEDGEEYAVLQSICRNSVDDQVKNTAVGKWPAYKKVLLKVSQPCAEMLIRCQFGLIPIECDKIFNTILTDGGVCCIFNGLSPKFMMKSVFKLGIYIFFTSAIIILKYFK